MWDEGSGKVLVQSRTQDGRIQSATGAAESGKALLAARLTASDRPKNRPTRRRCGTETRSNHELWSDRRTTDTHQRREALIEERAPIAKVRDVMESPSGFDPAWSGMAELGWAGLTVAEDYGGAGLDWVDLAVLLEEPGGLLPRRSYRTRSPTAISEFGNDERSDASPLYRQR